jgi:hypothetical protein
MNLEILDMFGMSEREQILKKVRNDGSALEYAAEEFKCDREIVVEAVKAGRGGYEFASVDLRADRSITIDAIKKNGWNLKYTSDELKSDREIVLEAVKQNVNAIMFASEELKGDYEFFQTVKKYSDMAHANRDTRDFIEKSSLEFLRLSSENQHFEMGEISQEELDELIEIFSVKYKIDYTPNMFLSMEELIYSDVNVELSHICKLPMLKTIKIKPDVNTYAVFKQIDKFKELFEKGIEVEWLNNYDGGEFLFEFTYGVGDCGDTDSQTNYYYLFSSPKEMIDFMENPSPFIENLFVDVTYNSVFRKIEEAISNECGSGDVYLNINKVFDNAGEQHLFWEHK